ncbi:MAG TPA: hypothetical protein VMG59_10205 [Phycisphaerae bacterium]|nr:hypothetical protein [Phycisphaerae bacterium]
MRMQKQVRKFRSHAQAEAADRAYYKSLTPEQRLDILLDIVNSQRSNDENSRRLARIHTVIKRPRR